MSDLFSLPKDRTSPMLKFTPTPYNDYEISEANFGPVLAVYDKLGPALHHFETGHETRPGCCPAVDCLGRVILPKYR